MVTPPTLKAASQWVQQSHTSDRQFSISHLSCMNEEGFSSSSNTAHKHSEWLEGAGTLPRFMLYLMKKVGLKDSPLVKVQHFHPVIKSEVIGLVCS